VFIELVADAHALRRTATEDVIEDGVQNELKTLAAGPESSHRKGCAIDWKKV